jgi:uncharacterized protein YmfQ (DUF2313 family)
METTPSQSLDSIPDWETELGLPEKCVTSLSPSLDARRLEIFRKFNSSGGQSPQYYEELAGLLGFNVQVEELYGLSQPFKVGVSKVGDALTQGAWLFTWRVIVSIPEVSVQSFKVGQNVVGDPLRWWAMSEIECFLHRIKPSHTTLIFTYNYDSEVYMIGNTGEPMVGDTSVYMTGGVA